MGYHHCIHSCSYCSPSDFVHSMTPIDQFFLKWAPSMVPVVLKAQHDPHEPWFLTGVTAPLAIQLMLAGLASLSSTEDSGMSSAAANPVYCLTNSSLVRSANWLIPTVKVWRPRACSALCFSMNFKWLAKILLRM